MERLNRLNNVKEEEFLEEYVLAKMERYNNHRKIQRESVAEHSFFVSLFCLKMLKNMKISDTRKFNVMVLATLHDVPEVVTSDIPHNVKQMNPEIKSILEFEEKEYIRYRWREYYDCVFTTDLLVQSLVGLADAYSVYQFCLNEIELGNVSKGIQKIKEDAWKRICNCRSVAQSLYREEQKQSFQEEVKEEGRTEDAKEQQFEADKVSAED